MSKFERVLSDDDLVDIFALGIGDLSAKPFNELVEVLEQAIISKLKAEQEPVAWASSKIVGHYIPNDTRVTAEDWFKEGLDVPLYTHPSPSASETGAFVLRCDYCKKETDDPWHGSGFIGDVKSKHIHACDDCVHLLPTPRLMY